MSNDKTDWSRTEAARNAQAGQGSKRAQGSAKSGALVPAETVSQLPVPATLSGNLPGEAQPGGIIARWKSNTLTRKAALQELEVRYNARLDIVKIQLEEVVKIEKTRVAVLGKQYLQQLNAEYVEMLNQLEMANHNSRSNLLLELADSTADKLRQAQEADWPPELIVQTVNNLFELQKNAMARIITEFKDSEK